MDGTLVWLATLTTVGVLAGSEGVLALAQRRRPDRLAEARTLHCVRNGSPPSGQKGSELLAAQTLRNSLMSATVTASTAVLGLIGTSPWLRLGFGERAAPASITPRLVLELLLLTLLFASLVCSAMTVRYYNHVGFISGMPVVCEPRQRWTPAGMAYVRRAGILYSRGLRHLILVAPILASLLHPFAAPVAALLVVLVLSGFDRLGGK